VPNPAEPFLADLAKRNGSGGACPGHRPVIFLHDVQVAGTNLATPPLTIAKDRNPLVGTSGDDYGD
jgi:hypothetical protein